MWMCTAVWVYISGVIENKSRARFERDGRMYRFEGRKSRRETRPEPAADGGASQREGGGLRGLRVFAFENNLFCTY